MVLEYPVPNNLTDYAERISPTTMLSIPGYGGLLPAKWFGMSESERAVHEWRERQKHRAGRPSEYVKHRDIFTLTRLGAPVSSEGIENSWKLFTLLLGDRPFCLECDNCGFVEWTETVVRDDNRKDAVGYSVSDFRDVRLDQGRYVVETQQKTLTWFSRDIGEKRYYFCNVPCFMAWERARPRLNKVVRRERTDTFTLADGQEVRIRVKSAT